YYGGTGSSPLGDALLYFTSVKVSLDVDVNRTGAVSQGVKDKGSWSWGPDGTGAILLVNCDRDRQNTNTTDGQDLGLPNEADLKDMSQMVLTAKGPDKIFTDHQLALHISCQDATKMKVYGRGRYFYTQVLGGTKLLYKVNRGNEEKIDFYVEGSDFPDMGFNGLVYINLSLLRCCDETEIFLEKVVFRLTPWIMTPNTQDPLEVFVCCVCSNEKFLQDLTDFVKKANCKLNICPETENKGDRWIQDEMEFGYIEAPHKLLPVVLDSPRDRELNVLPFKKILGPDFGYVTREPENKKEIDSLDGFGNLEVSPPVTANGKNYPLGRILIGGSFPE
ncbi:hypothetical protein GDO86_020541, partial [Hymenochirus boettgeri]